VEDVFFAGGFEVGDGWGGIFVVLVELFEEAFGCHCGGCIYFGYLLYGHIHEMRLLASTCCLGSSAVAGLSGGWPTRCGAWPSARAWSAVSVSLGDD
jgi:hypothetical protein